MKKIFRMPTPVKITGRTSSITNAFVNGIIPVIEPTEEEIESALKTLGMDKDHIVCAYCGNPYTECTSAVISIYCHNLSTSFCYLFQKVHIFLEYPKTRNAYFLKRKTAFIWHIPKSILFGICPLHYFCTCQYHQPQQKKTADFSAASSAYLQFNQPVPQSLLSQ